MQQGFYVGWLRLSGSQLGCFRHQRPVLRDPSLSLHWPAAPSGVQGAASLLVGPLAGVLQNHLFRGHKQPF